MALALAAGPASAGTIAYTYDSQGRLASALYPDGTCVAYAYDAAGNRTQYVTGASGPPAAGTVTVSIYQDIAARFDPRINAPGCAALTVTAVGSPGHGTAVVQNGGVGITYTPSAGYTGPDSFSYTISNGAQTATGTVSMTVNAPTLAPVANNAFGRFKATIPPPPSVTPSVFKDLTASVSDPYGYPLIISSVTQGSAGTVTFSGLGVTWNYGQSVSSDLQLGDAFTYTVSDGHGHTATGTVNVKVLVVTRTQ